MELFDARVFSVNGTIRRGLGDDEWQLALLEYYFAHNSAALKALPPTILHMYFVMHIDLAEYNMGIF